MREDLGAALVRVKEDGLLTREGLHGSLFFVVGRSKPNCRMWKKSQKKERNRSLVTWRCTQLHRL